MKVIIVGAGPAGLACAEQILALSDFDVTVVDKKRRVGENPRCAGGLSLFMVQRVGFEIPEPAIIVRIKKIRIFAPNMTFSEMKVEDYGIVLNREVFEQKMAERVSLLGAHIYLNNPVSALALDQLKHEYEYVVGADGSASVVRRWIGLPAHCPDDVHVGVQKTITMEQFSQDTIELYFGEKVAPQGYAWLFPGGDGMVRAGLAIPVSKGSLAMPLLDRFIDRQVDDFKVTTTIGKQIPTAKMPKTGVYGKFLLVGDALPSTDPLTGGGIAQAIASGMAAGRALVDRNPKNYDSYISWLRKQNNKRYRLKHIVTSFSDKDFNDLIEVLQGFRPKTMSIGKELRRAVIHLLLRKPRLLSKFFKYLG